MNYEKDISDSGGGGRAGGSLPLPRSARADKGGRTMKINRNLVISLIIHVLTFTVFYLAGIASWEFLERFTNHIRHGKLAEGLASHFGMQVFFVLELLLAFVPRHKIKVSLILIYATYAFWQWFPPSYTPYRFLYHAVFGTVLMICAEIVSCRLTRKHTEDTL